MRVSRYKLQSPSLVRGDVSARKNSRETTYDSQRSHGFTLIELLVTISIIAILATVFLGVSNSAIESGRRARTKSVIAKIHGLLMERWDSYKTRRVEIDPDIINSIDTAGFSPRQRGQILSDIRLLARRELMLLEMPDSWSDVLLNTVSSNSPLDEPRILSSFPPLRNTYLRRFYDIVSSVSAEVIEENQGAECLYMIVMFATGDGEARTLFSERDIGDTDGDGAPEFLDGWGRPIHFIRWAPGFAPRSDLMLGNADADHDSFDTYRRDQVNVPRPPISSYSSFINTLFIDELDDDNSAFRLLPLVYSAGPDGETDIDDLAYDGNAPPTSLDPYAYESNLTGTIFVPTNWNYVFGLPFDKNGDDRDNSIDNIHNHLQDNQ